MSKTSPKKDQLITRATGTRLLDEFLARVHEVNQSSRFLLGVREVVLFGSYLKTKKERVGDVDLAIDLFHKIEDPDARVEAIRAHVHTAPDRYQGGIGYVFWPYDQVFLFLKHRSRGLSLHNLTEHRLLKTRTHKVIFLHPDHPRSKVPRRPRTWVSPVETMMKATGGEHA